MIDLRKWNLKILPSKFELICAITKIVDEIVSDPFKIICVGADLAIKTDDGIMYLKAEECFIEHKDEFILVPTKIREMAELYQEEEEVN